MSQNFDSLTAQGFSKEEISTALRYVQSEDEEVDVRAHGVSKILRILMLMVEQSRQPFKGEVAQHIFYLVDQNDDDLEHNDKVALKEWLLRMLLQPGQQDKPIDDENEEQEEDCDAEQQEGTIIPSRLVNALVDTALRMVRSSHWSRKDLMSSMLESPTVDLARRLRIILRMAESDFLNQADVPQILPLLKAPTQATAHVRALIHTALCLVTACDGYRPSAQVLQSLFGEPITFAKSNEMAWIPFLCANIADAVTGSRSWKALIPASLTAYISHFKLFPTNSEKVAVLRIILAAFEVYPLKQLAVKLLPQMLPIFMNGLAEIDESWSNDHEHGVEEGSFHEYAEVFDLTTVAVASKDYADTVLSQSFTWLESEEWQKRFAAVYTIFLTAEGCRKFFKPRLEEIMSKVTAACVDFPHYRVRWGLLQLYGGLSNDLGKSFVTRFHATIYGAVLRFLEDDHEQVVAQAGRCLINLFEKGKPKLVQPLLPQVGPKLLLLLQHPLKSARGHAISAVAALAELLGSDFCPLFAQFDPVMKNLWLHACRSAFDSEEDCNIIEKLLETMTIIGANVGKELFGADAVSLCKYLVSAEFQMSPLSASEVIPTCFARLAKVLREEFVPFLPGVLPHFFQRIHAAEDAISVADDSDPSDECIKVGTMLLNVKSEVIDGAIDALGSLLAIANFLEGALLPFVKVIAEVALRAMKFRFHLEIQLHALDLLAQLFCVVNKEEPQSSLKLWQTCEQDIYKLVISLDVESYTHYFHTLQLTVPQITGIQFESIKEIHRLMVCAMNILFDNEKEGAENNDDDDDDEEEEEEAQLKKAQFGKHKIDFLLVLSNLVSVLFEPFPDDYFQLFCKDVEPHAVRLCQSENSGDITAGLCFIHDVFEFCPAMADKYAKKYLPLLLQHACHPDDPDVRQACFSALGWICLHAQDNVKPALMTIAQICRKVITAPHSRSSVNVLATENAIGAFSKLLLRWHTALPEPALKSLVQFFLQCLPVSNDLVEARSTYSNLLTLCQKIPNIFLGDNRRNAAPLQALLKHIQSQLSADERFLDHITQVNALFSFADA